MPSVAEVHDDLSVRADGNQSAVAAERRQHLVQELVYRLRERQSAELDRRAHVMGGHGADEVLAVAGGRDRRTRRSCA